MVKTRKSVFKLRGDWRELLQDRIIHCFCKIYSNAWINPDEFHFQGLQAE